MLKKLKKHKSLLKGTFIGVLIMFFIAYLYHKNKNNIEVITVKEAAKILTDISPESKKNYCTNEAIYLEAKYFETLGDDAKDERFPLEFYQPKLTGNFYEHKVRLNESLFIKTYTTRIHDITDEMRYSLVTDLIPINIDSLVRKTIYMKNRYSKVNEKEISENIALEVTKNSLVRLTDLSGYQKTGICIPTYINNTPTMFFFVFNNMNGYIMKSNEGWIGKIGEFDFTTKYFEDNTVFLEKDIDALKKLKRLEKLLYYKKNSFLFKKGQIYNRVLNKPLLSKTMDTLYCVGRKYDKQLIVAEKNNKKYLFNGLLQDITPGNFQAICNDEMLSVLVNNEVYSIDDKGELYKIENKENTNYNDDFYYLYEIKEENETSFYITCKGYETNNSFETYKTTPISQIEFPKTVTFVNNKKNIRVLGNNMDEGYNYLITQVNGLYGLYEFEDMIRGYDFEEEAEETIINTKLTNLLPNKYTQMHADEMTHLVFFEENGLKGYFPLHKKGRYKQLSNFLNNAFAKFTLPDGRKGWLQNNGKEYFY